MKTFASRASTGTLQRKKSMCSEEEIVLGLPVTLTGINRGLKMKLGKVQISVSRQISPKQENGIRKALQVY